MVKVVRDTMHGFGERPHYEPRELDSIFEKIVTDFLRKKQGEIEFPIQTDDLTTLIEEHVKDLDLYADLTKYGPGVEGVTIFARAGKPRVLISEYVHKHQNRLRTTLTHEFVHVHLHAYLFALLNGQMRFSITIMAIIIIMTTMSIITTSLRSRLTTSRSNGRTRPLLATTSRSWSMPNRNTVSGA